jgi:hypothetical protein
VGLCVLQVLHDGLLCMFSIDMILFHVSIYLAKEEMQINQQN